MLMESMIDSLRAQLRDPSLASNGPSILDHHGRGSGPYEHPPDAVVFAETVEDVSATLRFAAAERVPVVPFGAGTSLSGVAIPIFGGISLDLSRMDRVLAVDPEGFTATVQPGVLRHALNRHLRDFGLFFPVDPGADASIGGMCATNASGTTTVRYGSMRGNVRTLQVVLAGGSVIRAGVRAKKSSAGYDLLNLFVGSEGTLGVITEATLRVYPVLERVVSARAVFPDVEAASLAVVALIGAGVGLTRSELLDGHTIGIINGHNGTAMPELPTILLEIGGSEAVVSEEMHEARRLCEAEGATAFELEADAGAQARLWQMRHDFAGAMATRYPGKAQAGTDICVPISELPGAIRHARSEVARLGMDAALISHAGDGNFHLTCALDRDDPRDSERYDELYSALVDYAIARGGTCSGEHGIGIRGIPFLERQHPDLVPWMKGIKKLFDPAGIMNPGKVLAG